MPERNDNLRHLFDGLVAAPDPSPAQTESARATLHTAMRGGEPAPHRWARPRLVPVAIAAFVVLVVVFTTVAPWSRDRAAALLEELAVATRSIEPQQLPAGSYVYVESESVVLADAAAEVDGEMRFVLFLLPKTAEAWWQGDGARVETTVERPVFFDQEAEGFYYGSGLDEADSVGETTVDVFEGVANQLDPDEWSTDPDELAAQMRQTADDDPAEVPLDVKMLELADQLLAPQLLASPALRAAILDVLATLDLDQTQLDGGRISASITYERQGFGTVTTELVFDANGYLIERRSLSVTGDEQGLFPAGTAFDSLIQTPPVTVSEPGVRPAQ